MRDVEALTGKRCVPEDEQQETQDRIRYFDSFGKIVDDKRGIFRRCVSLHDRCAERLQQQ